ncbi:MAG: UDP-N-acetylmuramoyl-L-alanyl-D-glutamate--2,6-diaminopimelate ligase [Acidimicrobiia bacterium]|nr:UDP-N-acetylmuramoyl-L-alanyl-D-glutamate--2,6-diaminopimelate ligase [bacterium]MYB23758.1 UDP-N-acetylmuramoyl-L-alanyl-D-glutamate--2,6-diaminopimelate ligase [Acidimicrobiia bacterium]
MGEPTLLSLRRRSRVGGRLHVPAGAGSQDPSISSVCEDSRDVRVGALFCCVPGRSGDGHDFAAAAVAAGAAALLVERPMPVGLPQLVVREARAAVGPLALAAAGSPQEHLELLGVTGTNGKTTVAHLLSSILECAGRRCVAIGTLSGPLTTPRASDLARRLAAARASGASAAAVEASSHGLAQKRLEGLRFAASAFTNLSPEHLDYHRDMEDYYRAKRVLFEDARSAVSVVCTDDLWGRRLAEEVTGDLRRCSRADAALLEAAVGHSRIRWRRREITLPLGGAHNVANAVVAATVADALGVDDSEIAEGLRRAPRLAGRFEVVAESPAAVIVDFAHSPAALEQLLRAGRSLLAAPARLTVVFGCGGERDEGKREAMGEIASRLADRVIVTSDNPRGEDPASIARAVMAGVEGGGAELELDRRSAIAAALAEAERGDVVIVAGKGHETCQIIGGRSLPFDDAAVVRELLRGRAEVATA